MNLRDKSLPYKRLPVCLYSYWLLLMAWQTMRPVANRSSVDIAAKAVLIIALAISVIMIRLPLKTKNFVFFHVFALFMILHAFIKESNLSAVNAISYGYSILFAYLFFVHIGKFKMSQIQYIGFLNLLIGAVSMMAAYSMAFRSGKFIGAFSVRNAYGNELTSFFTSNHEYALYLLLGCYACLFCYQRTLDVPAKHQKVYLFLLAIYAVNLILTYSRTALLGASIMLAAFVMLSKMVRAKKIIVVTLFFAVVIFLLSQTLQGYVFNIILKNSDDAGRFTMWRYGLGLYSNFSVFDIMTGYGGTATRVLLESLGNHASFHNAYIQILVQYGIIGMLFFIGIILGAVKNALMIMRHDRFVGSMILSLTLATVAIMATNTTIIMQSNVDSFIITVVVFVMPIYMKNSVIAGQFKVSSNTIVADHALSRESIDAATDNRGFFS